MSARSRMLSLLLLLTPVTPACRPGAAGAGAATQSPRVSVVERHGRLRVRGNQIVDEHGDPVQLRGMSLFWSQWMPQFYNDSAIRWLRDDWNVSVVRAAIAVHMGGYMEHPAVETQKADAVIDAAIREGIYVIVDWHAHQPEAAAASRFFSHVAGKYGRYPNVIYETWNEPLNVHPWSTVIKPYHMTVIAAIRALDPDNLIVAGSRTWSQDVDEAAADPLPFNNVAYSLHFYAGTHKQGLRDKAERAMARGAALMITEWGTANADGNGAVDSAETRRWLDFADRHKLSWANWSITDRDEGTAALRPGAPGTGGWTPAQITTSGTYVRNELRSHPAP
jgi:endoglucanase